MRKLVLLDGGYPMRKLVLLLVGGGLMALLASMMVLVMTNTSPTQAGLEIEICHYDPGKVTQNKVHRDHSWSIIMIAPTALDMHLENHEDPGGTKDAQVSQGDCDTLDAGLDRPLLPPGPPGQD